MKQIFTQIYASTPSVSPASHALLRIRNSTITLSNALTFTLSACENLLLKFARANDSRKILSWNRKLKRLIFIRILKNLEKSVWESKSLLWTSLKPSILMFRMRWISWKQWFNNVDYQKIINFLNDQKKPQIWSFFSPKISLRDTNFKYSSSENKCRKIIIINYY